MATSLLKDPWLSGALLEEPHLERVVIITGTDQDGLIGHEVDCRNSSSVVRELDDRINLLFVQVPEGDRRTFSTNACQETYTHCAI
jgi:hypothetical protein